MHGVQCSAAAGLLHDLGHHSSAKNDWAMRACRTDSFGSMVGGKPASPSMRGPPSSPLKQSSGAPAGPTGLSSSSQALPEDLFGPGPAQTSPSAQAPQYGGQPSRFGMPGQQPSSMQQQQQQQQQRHPPLQPYQQQHSQSSSPTAFGSFAGSGPGMQGPGGFQSPLGSRVGQQQSNGSSSWQVGMLLVSHALLMTGAALRLGRMRSVRQSCWAMVSGFTCCIDSTDVQACLQGSGGADPYAGLGSLSTPPPQQFAAPPPPQKKDPFAGLTGF